MEVAGSIPVIRSIENLPGMVRVETEIANQGGSPANVTYRRHQGWALDYKADFDDDYVEYVTFGAPTDRFPGNTITGAVG